MFLQGREKEYIYGIFLLLQGRIKREKNVGKFSEFFQTRNPDPDLSNGIFVVDIFSPQKLWIHLSYNLKKHLQNVN